MVYVFAAKSNYETIESFIAVQGGLTKETFSHDQFYRLASSFFLHLTPFHLGLNILTLAIFGRYVEVIFGRTKFFNVLLLSAFSGSMISWLFSAADVVVGASGGIYGLIGAYFIAWKKYNRFLPGSTYVSDRTMYFILVAQIIVDINLPNIDMFSHIGGFCSGLLYAAWSTKGRSASKASTAYPFEIHISHVSSFAYFAGLAYFFVFILAPSI
jgi:rhomboid protease GluP